jgi:hypothetical protein
MWVKTAHRLPVKTLQLEQMAVMGSSEEPSVVASRMQLVFSTLEVCSSTLGLCKLVERNKIITVLTGYLTLQVVSPQWPKV